MATPFLAMTTLSPEMEKTLLRFPYSTLIKILRTKTTISGTDCNYTAVQWISKELTMKEIEKAIEKFKDDLDKPEASRLYTKIDKEEEPTNPVDKPIQQPRPVRVDTGNAHPQPVINAKTAAAKAAGGSISYSRVHKGWLVTKANKSELVWTSEQFRNFSESQITDLIKAI
jgi:hypothetical protein